MKQNKLSTIIFDRFNVQVKVFKLTCKEDLSATNWFPGPSPGALHQRPLLRQQQVILCLIHQISKTTVENRLTKYQAQHMIKEKETCRIFSERLKGNG